MTDSWSFAGRLRFWFGLSTLIAFALATMLGGVYLWLSVDRELDALVEEEIDEMVALFASTDGTPAAFEDVAGELDRRHPANPLAWRAWRADSGAPWATYGHPSIVAGIDVRATPPGRTLALDRRRYRVVELTPEVRMALVVDGSAQIDTITHFGFLGIAFAVISVAIALAGGAWIGRRIAALLRGVAERVRSIEDVETDVDLQVPAAPDEIRVVVESFEDVLRKIRREDERTRLMTAGLAHELRSPIQNLMSETEVALLRERKTEEYRRVLSEQLDELRDLARVVDNLVTLCAIGDTSSARTLEEFDIGEELRLRLQRERSRAGRDDVSIELTTAGDLRLQGDREALLLALHNLIRNGVEWSAPGETVEVDMLQDDGFVQILVEDRGPGIPAPLRERIFEPFFTMPRKEGRRAGYGMGLALAKKAVEIHDGTLEVASLDPCGSSFRIRIPRRRGPRAAASA